MDSVIDARHVSEPGLVVLDITAADEETALALMEELQQLWATSGPVFRLGVGWGRGLAVLGLAPGEEVAEAQLRNLFGERCRHRDPARTARLGGIVCGPLRAPGRRARGRGRPMVR
ncbi:DUF6207 family protein [Streptomyces sp. NPDC098077]|uniref:DUF6207 family protein n=1 Tax=Streptomyces sp. NPDC098077 TaxID=3366093 RepID=UPI0037F8B17C